VETSETERLER